MDSGHLGRLIRRVSVTTLVSESWTLQEPVANPLPRQGAKNVKELKSRSPQRHAWAANVVRLSTVIQLRIYMCLISCMVVEVKDFVFKTD